MALREICGPLVASWVPSYSDDAREKIARTVCEGHTHTQNHADEHGRFPSVTLAK